MRNFWFILLISFSAFAKPARFFQGDLLGGGQLALRESLKPNRRVLVCFWASWCAPCLEELKMVKEKLKEDPSLPVDVITVNVDKSDTASDVKPTVKNYGIQFPVILDPMQNIFAKFQNGDTLPFSVLIGPSGDIETIFNGLHEDMFATVKQILASKGPKNAP